MRMQKQTVQTERSHGDVKGFIPVTFVSRDRMSGVSCMDPDLMRAACNDHDIHKRRLRGKLINCTKPGARHFSGRVHANVTLTSTPIDG